MNIHVGLQLSKICNHVTIINIILNLTANSIKLPSNFCKNRQSQVLKIAFSFQIMTVNCQNFTVKFCKFYSQISKFAVTFMQ